LYQEVLRLVKQKSQLGKNQQQAVNDYEVCPIDSTVITLTSKLLWVLGYHQVKLLTVFNNEQKSGEYPLIHFGQDHDYKFATQMTENLSEKQVGVMDRGFASLDYLKQLQAQKKLFVIRVNGNYKLEALANGLWQVGTGAKQGIYRVVWFCDLETQTEYRLVTNLPDTISAEEVMAIYIQRWLIELFWKFLKMHLKLDNFISKSVNGIAIQLYSCLIGYLILLLVDVPEMWGNTSLDKLCYLQGCMGQEFSYIHWIDRILENRPFRLIMGAIA